MGNPRYVERVHIAHSVYYSILLRLFYFIIAVVVNLLLYFIYKLNFIIDMHVEEKT